jgi:hypothetical protein
VIRGTSAPQARTYPELEVRRKKALSPARECRVVIATNPSPSGRQILRQPMLFQKPCKPVSLAKALSLDVSLVIGWFWVPVRSVRRTKA